MSEPAHALAGDGGGFAGEVTKALTDTDLPTDRCFAARSVWARRSTMDEILTALTDQQAELARLVDGLDEREWLLETSCPGWTIADVVLHLAQSDELALASVQGRFADVLAELADGLGPASSIDEGADLMVARDRDRPGSEIRARWEAATTALDDALVGCDPGTKCMWVAGAMSARTLATTRLAETWIHTGDVAAPLGVTLAATDRLAHIARLAWRTLPYAFARAGRDMTGPVAFELSGPAGEPWCFAHEGESPTTIRGAALDLCLVAGQRMPASATGLAGEGPDAEDVLELVRTFA